MLIALTLVASASVASFSLFCAGNALTAAQEVTR